MPGVGLPLIGWLVLVLCTLAPTLLVRVGIEQWRHDRDHTESGDPHTCKVCFRFWTQHRMSTKGEWLPRKRQPASHRPR